MSNEGWIDITEYAVKYRVSQSTLRRRIRSNTIAFRMDRGKYLLLDTPEALNKAPLFSRQQYTSPAHQSVRPHSTWSNPSAHQQVQSFNKTQASTNVDPVNEIRRLNAEIANLQFDNKALKERLAEAETLVKVLEAELQSYNA